VRKSIKTVAVMVMLINYVDQLVAFGDTEVEARALLFEAFKRRRKQRAPSHPAIEALKTMDDVQNYFGLLYVPIKPGVAVDLDNPDFTI